VKKEDEVVSGKSIMGLLTLAANQGSVLEIEISGNDAEAAMKALEDFLTGDEDDAPPPPAAPRKDTA
jgi:phosphocarrier protein